MATIIRPDFEEQIDYPESDGTPVGESDIHIRLMTDLIFALRWFLAEVRAYVAGNMFIYYEEGNPKAVICPDVFVAYDVESYPRRSYKVWEEDGRLPNVMIELTSKSTRKADQEQKPQLYARLGVQEYFMFDPYGEWLNPRLQGFRLESGVYRRIETSPVHSRVLGLDLRVFENSLRLHDARTGERLRTPDEEVGARAKLEVELRRETEARQREAEALRRETEARREAEAEIARLRALLAQQQAGEEQP
jgi:Uma2 family endonuclease